MDGVLKALMSLNLVFFVFSKIDLKYQELFFVVVNTHTHNNITFTILTISKCTIAFRPSPAAAKSLQSCPTLCDPIDGGPPGFPVPGILQARTLEWVAISFSNA